MTANELMLHGSARDDVVAFFEPRAADVDGASVDVRAGLAFLHERVLASDSRDPNADLLFVASTIATVAWSDLASAFALWCHRMVIEYLSHAPPAGGPRREVLPALLRARLFGSTGLASAMAHYLSGAPLPLTARRSGDDLVLDGKVRWASNLFAPDFVLVTAAHGPDGAPPFIVALAGDTPGLSVDRYPELLALQATASSSLTLNGVRVSRERVVSEDFDSFIPRVRPTFLVLQSSFCWGLARRALDEARAALDADGGVLRPDLDGLEERAAELGGALRGAASSRAAGVSRRALVSLRLEAARLAVAATQLELKALGSRAFLRRSGTARRLREAAFLPIQAPTEAQLRSELARAEEPEIREAAALRR